MVHKNKHTVDALLFDSPGEFDFPSRKGAYRIIERRLREFLVDGNFQFNRIRERIE